MIPTFLSLPLNGATWSPSQRTEYDCKSLGVMLPLDSDKPIEKAELNYF